MGSEPVSRWRLRTTAGNKVPPIPSWGPSYMADEKGLTLWPVPERRGFEH